MIDLEKIIKRYGVTDSEDKLEDTSLCKLFRKYGSDKSLPSDFKENKVEYTYKCKIKERCLHNYSHFYHHLFESIKKEKIVFFEMGIGSRKKEVPSNMTHMEYTEDLEIGSSLRAWSDYFENAKIYGADIDPSLVFEEKNMRIKTFYCDQNSREDFLKIANQIGEPLDVIIDDGRHTPEANLNFFNASFDHLKSGGVYIIEDVMLTGERKKLHEENISHFETRASFVELIELDSSFNGKDNNLIVILK